MMEVGYTINILLKDDVYHEVVNVVVRYNNNEFHGVSDLVACPLIKNPTNIFKKHSSFIISHDIHTGVLHDVFRTVWNPLRTNQIEEAIMRALQ